MTATELISQFLQLLDISEDAITITTLEDDSLRVDITIPQEESGVFIGYKGEKLDAIQYLLNILINKDTISYTPVNVDINGYRAKREESLKEMAQTAATKAIESGREILLPILPPAERRIIHMYLADNDKVTTYSEGEPPTRRLVVRPEVSQVGD